MSLCNPAESDEMEPLPVMLVRDLSIYGSTALKITCSTSTKNLSGLICQEDEIIKLHNLCNLCNLEESDEIENFPYISCQGFVHIWECSAEKLKISLATRSPEADLSEI